MIIGVDGRELERKPTGVGTYLLNILQHLRLQQEARLHLYFKKEIPGSVAAIDAEKILLPFGGSNLLWQQTHLSTELNQRKVKLFFSPTPSCPLLFSGRQVITVLDLSFFHHPEWFRVKEKISRQLQLRLALKKADRIYVISEPMVAELISMFSVPESKILLTPISVTPKTMDSEKRNRLKKSYQLGEFRTVLYVGSIFNRRHLPLLIEAFSGLPENSMLVLIGENRTYPYQDLREFARHRGVENRIRFLEYVTEDVLEDYYRLSDVFVYLSTYEGFGIPPLEAMSYGIPTVISKTPVMDTVFQGASRFVTLQDASEIRIAIQECLEDQSVRNRLIEAGFKLVQSNRWEETASLISADWEQLIGGRS